MKNKKGFTFIELMVAISFISIISIVLSSIPTNLSLFTRSYNKNIEKDIDIEILAKAISQDHSKNPKYVEEHEGKLLVGKYVYEFTDKGVYRISNQGRIKVAKLPLNYKLKNNMLRIYTNHNQEEVLRYNLAYTSFSSAKQEVDN